MRMMLAFSLILVGCAGSDDKVSGILELEGDAALGETLYADNCAGCHGADGEGGSGPAMTDEVPELSDEEIVDVIVNGYEEMPAQDQLADQDVADVLAYLNATFE